jgi:hypothetical protein
MAFLSYNGVRIDVLPQMGARTLNVLERAIYSDDGIDYHWHQVIIEVQGIVNPSVIAVTPGATAGNTLWALQNVLKQPRGELTFDISNDRVIQAPPRLNADGTQVTMTAIAQALAAGVALPGTLAPCDCDGGPFPEELKIIEVQGTKSALIYFRVRCTINLCNNIVLTNRWEMTHHIDELHYTTRTINGTLQIRRDLGDFLGFKPDDFRSSIVIQCPSDMQRDKVEVHQGSDFGTLEYTVVDRETPLTSGVRFPGVRIEGNATSGYETDLKAFIADALRSLPDVVPRVAGRIVGWGLIGEFGNAASAAKSAVRASIPIPMANGLCRVYGDYDSNKLDLAAIGLNVLIDRFTNPAFGGRVTTLLSCISCYVTQDLIQRMIEIRMEFIPLPASFGAFKSLAPAKVIAKGAFMNMNSPINLDPVAVGGVTQLVTGFTNNPAPPNSNQTVGTYVGNMIAQAFTDACADPVLPPGENVRRDVSNMGSS